MLGEGDSGRPGLAGAAGEACPAQVVATPYPCIDRRRSRPTARAPPWLRPRAWPRLPRGRTGHGASRGPSSRRRRWCGWLRRRAMAAPEPRAQPTACSNGLAAACGSNSSRSWLTASMAAVPWSSRATPESEEGRVERRVGDRGARTLGLRSGGATGQQNTRQRRAAMAWRELCMAATRSPFGAFHRAAGRCRSGPVGPRYWACSGPN